MIAEIKGRACLKLPILLGLIIWTFVHVLIDVIGNFLIYDKKYYTVMKSIWHFFMYLFMTYVVYKNYIMIKPELIDSNLLNSLKFSNTFQLVFKFLFKFLNSLMIIDVFAYSIISLI